MSTLLSTTDMLKLRTLQEILPTFASSPLTFQVLCTLPHPTPPPPQSLQILYILDSSFNPPTRAHFRICTSALHDDRPSSVPKRLLLLLATQNADKAPKPAAFEQRLAMMGTFAEELVEALMASANGEYKEGELIVDVGVTKEARFVDKARVLEDYKDYHHEGKPVEQVHLTGFDTLIRLLDTKYYPPQHNLEPLTGLFKKHRVRATRRTDDEWGGREEQDGYLKRIANGDRENEGARKGWVDRIELVEGRKEGEEVVSSTKVREAAKGKDEGQLRTLVTDKVAKWIIQENLYLE
ncbi:hypothetical protein MMC21_007549 [Puttea exsequens]|nr:hypothetical protein [Puttea exsequens]